LVDVNCVYDSNEFELHEVSQTEDNLFSEVENSNIRNVSHKQTRKNAIVEYLDYQIPDTQLKGPKGNGDMQAAKHS